LTPTGTPADRYHRGMSSTAAICRNTCWYVLPAPGGTYDTFAPLGAVSRCLPIGLVS